MPKPIIEVDSPLREGDRRILVCQNTSCAAKQSAEILAKFQDEPLPSNCHAYPVGCQGQCSVAPTVRIVPDETWYCRLTPEDTSAICDALREDTVVEEKLNPRIHRYSHY
ncbi:NADH dehydrogenase (quinone) [[Leptolyngbya] sp. PCC 7376]|uniref:(2Fe-2S) ferredoxin domain-containing protein n=1 Tax=[Leptolyngbya] sp. PCC 7376 TaxID=111781 RepID=UPI00029EC8FD|nr:(2Fe-2S) ferredoxin domain-containing protein [[Leptolyngbya] sp. PCC 7376]AFY40257.1 NADH dehydrogenase (quinone) [[Leptolyngbya] sp. PCC 7376]